MTALLRTALTGLLLASVPATVALANDPGQSSFSGSYLAGRSAAKARDNDLASGYLSDALKVDSGNPILTEKIFLLELADGNMPKAEEFATEVLKFNSQQRMARIVLGVKDLKAGRYVDARKNFEQSAYTPIGELTSWLLTAWSYAGEGQLNPALKALDRLDSNESFANFKAFHEALIADYLGNDVRAEAAYKKAYEAASGSLRVVQAYGNFLDRHGRAPEAQTLYRAFIANDGNPLVEAALAESLKGVKPKPFIASASEGAAEALFSLATSMTDDQSIDVALLYTQLGISMGTEEDVMFTLLGDTYETNEWVDNVLVTWDGWLGRAAKLYANGKDLKDPQLSPIYGDFSKFPPTILTSGTRDLFLSNTVRTHRKLRRAGVVADLNVYEGQSHAQYSFNMNAPETTEAFTDIAKFFDRYLAK